MQTTITLTHPSGSHSLRVEVDFNEDIDPEPPHYRTVYVKSWQAETDYDEDGNLIATDWINENMILNNI